MPAIVSGDLLDRKIDATVDSWNRKIIPWWLLPQEVSGAIKKKRVDLAFQRGCPWWTHCAWRSAPDISALPERLAETCRRGDGIHPSRCRCCIVVGAAFDPRLLRPEGQQRPLHPQLLHAGVFGRTYHGDVAVGAAVLRGDVVSGRERIAIPAADLPFALD